MESRLTSERSCQTETKPCRCFPPCRQPHFEAFELPLGKQRRRCPGADPQLHKRHEAER